MSRSANVSFDWGDGHYTFRLGIKQLEELQEKCDAGPAFILGRLVDGSWRVKDIHETIRLGLIGGGAEPIKALALMKSYVVDRPLLENIIPAQIILNAALVGVEEEPVGKAEGESVTASHPSPVENSASPVSTAAGP